VRGGTEGEEPGSVEKELLTRNSSDDVDGMGGMAMMHGIISS
jgi:hypothetical protein